MIRIRIREDGDLSRDLGDIADRARSVGEVSGAIAEALTRQNERVSFDPDHAGSILEVEGETGRIGARAPRQSYAEVLRIDDDEIGDITKAWIVSGDR